MTKAYIVLQRGGLQNGVVTPTRSRLLVGANSAKDALRICKQVYDKTTGYKVYYRDANYDNQVPYGQVVHVARNVDPTRGLISYRGRLWCMDNQHYAVALGSRSNNPITIDPANVDYDLIEPNVSTI